MRKQFLLVILALFVGASPIFGATSKKGGGVAGSGDVATDTLFDAKGDIIGGTGPDTSGRLPLGTDGYLLEADSNESTGLKWVVAPSGSQVEINGASTDADFRDNYDAEFVVCTAADTPALGCLAADDVVIAIPNEESHTHTMMEIKTPTYCIDLYDEAATPQTSGSPDQLCDFDMTIIAPIICTDRYDTPISILQGGTAEETGDNNQETCANPDLDATSCPDGYCDLFAEKKRKSVQRYFHDQGQQDIYQQSGSIQSRIKIAQSMIAGSSGSASTMRIESDVEDLNVNDMADAVTDPNTTSNVIRVAVTPSAVGFDYATIIYTRNESGDLGSAFLHHPSKETGNTLVGIDVKHGAIEVAMAMGDNSITTQCTDRFDTGGPPQDSCAGSYADVLGCPDDLCDIDGSTSAPDVETFEHTDFELVLEGDSVDIADSQHVHTILAMDTTAEGSELTALTDSSETTLHSHAGGGEEVNTLTASTSIGDAGVWVGVSADVGAAIALPAGCGTDAKIEYNPGSPDTFDCEDISGLTDADIGDISNLAAGAVDDVGEIVLCATEGVSIPEFDNDGNLTCKESVQTTITGALVDGDILVYDTGSPASFKDVPIRGLAPTIYYVDDDASDDTGDGLTPSTAWKTIDWVNNFTGFVPGDSILFQRGDTFTEADGLIIPTSGQAGAPITFGSYAQDCPAPDDCDALAPVIDADGGNNAIAGTSMDFITIRNLKIENWEEFGIFNEDGDGWVVRGNWITTDDDELDIAVGVAFYTTVSSGSIQGGLITQNKIGQIGNPILSCDSYDESDGERAAISMRGIDNAEVSENYIYDIHGRGIRLQQAYAASDDPERNSILNNEITNVTSTAIAYHHGDFGFVKGNIIHDMCGIGISVHEGADDNVISGNYLDNILQSGVPGAQPIIQVYGGIDLNKNSDRNIFERNRLSRIVGSYISVENGVPSTAPAGDSEDNVIRYNYIDARTGREVGDDTWDYDLDFPNDDLQDFAKPIMIYAGESAQLDLLGTVTQGNFIIPGNRGTNTNLYATTYHDFASSKVTIDYTLDEWRQVGIDEGVETGVGAVRLAGTHQSHATDCTALTAGREGDSCFEVDDEILYLCKPDAAGELCDDTGDWVSIGGEGGGDVTKVGTPADNEVGVWTGSGTLEGDSNLTYDGDTLLVAQGNIEIKGTNDWDHALTIYDQDESDWVMLRVNNTNATLSTDTSTNFLFTPGGYFQAQPGTFVSFIAGDGYAINFEAGDLFNFKDKDDSSAVRATIDSATGDAWFEGSITGLISISIDDSSPTSPAMYGEDHYADVATGVDDHVYNLPDPPIAGMSGCFYDMGEGDGGITVAIPDGDFIWLDGVKGADGIDIDSPAVDGTGGNGEFICLVAISATDWVTKGRSGAWEATD